MEHSNSEITISKEEVLERLDSIDNALAEIRETLQNMNDSARDYEIEYEE